jgi:hypothetical protein
MDSQCLTIPASLYAPVTLITNCDMTPNTGPNGLMDDDLKELIAGLTPEEIRALVKKMKADVALLEGGKFMAYYLSSALCAYGDIPCGRWNAWGLDLLDERVIWN